VALSGLGEHPGRGGTVSTGQVGPETTRPAIPEEEVAPVAEPHATNATAIPMSAYARLIGTA
jgi:hypothetical protein